MRSAFPGSNPGIRIYFFTTPVYLLSFSSTIFPRFFASAKKLVKCFPRFESWHPHFFSFLHIFPSVGQFRAVRGIDPGLIRVEPLCGVLSQVRILASAFYFLISINSERCEELTPG